MYTRGGNSFIFFSLSLLNDKEKMLCAVVIFHFFFFLFSVCVFIISACGLYVDDRRKENGMGGSEGDAG